MSPVQKRCTLPPHEEATLPSWSPLSWPSPLPLTLPSPTPTPSPSQSPSPSPSQWPITVAAAVGHCCSCRQPVAAAISVASPSAITVAVALAIGHCRLHHCWPSQLPSPSAITVAMPLAISKSCCLGTAKIVFDQSKQRMLTLFYFVQTVGGLLIKAGSLTRCQAAMANTSVGRRAASSERLVRELAGGWGAAGSEEWRH